MLIYQRKILTLFLILVIPWRISAQFSIYAFTPPPAFSVDDLWNINIMLKGSSQFEEYFITLELFEKTLGKVAEAKTIEFVLKTSFLTINKSNYESFVDESSINYLNNQFFSSCKESGGRVPPGEYTAKYTLWGVIVDPVTGRVFEDLVIYESDIAEYSLYPPSLIHVYDQDTIFDLQPVFSWTPPFPLPIGKIIQYRIRFVEQYEGQNNDEAMLSNPAILELEQNQSTVLIYPSYALYMVKGSNYAWQVSAYTDNILLGKSEVWNFSVQNKSLQIEQNDNSIKKSCESVLNIRPNQRYSVIKDTKISFSFPKDVEVENTFICRMYDEDKKVVKLKSEKLTKNESGIYDIQSENISNGLYLLEVKMGKSTYYLRLLINIVR